jgi:hypothetical protein
MSLPGKPAPPTSRIWVTVLWVLLVLAVVAPVAFLVDQSASASNAARAQTVRERHAVAYLAALAPLTAELFIAQAFAVRGGALAFDDLTDAVARVGEIDRQWGDELRTHERWTALERAIGDSRGRRFPDAEAAAANYSEIVHQLLALHARIREQGGLLTDSAADTHYLAETVASELPATLAATEDYANGLVLVAAAEPDERTEPMAGVLAAAEAVTEGGEEISEFLELAVAQTDSPTLGRDLINELNTFRQTLDVLGAAGPEPQTDAAAADGRRVAVRNAGVALQTKILSTLDTLLVGRADRLAGTRRTLTLWLAPGAVLAVMVLATTLARRRRVVVLEEPDPLDAESVWGPPPTSPTSRVGVGPPLVGAVTRWRRDAPAPTSVPAGQAQAGQHVPR